MTPVYVYTQPDCKACTRAIHQLKAGGVVFRIIDISRDSLMRDYVIQHLQARSTPVVEAVGFPTIFGYQPDKIKTLIEELGCLPIEPDYTEIHDYVYEGDE